MSYRKRIRVPETMADITVEQYVRLVKANNPPKQGMDAVKLGMEVLCDLPRNVVQKMAFADVAKVARIMGKLMNPPKPEEYPLVPKFKLDGVEYGFIPDWGDLTLGEFVDLETACKGDVWENLPQILSVMYRPIKTEMGAFYEIHEYKPSPKQVERMKQAPMDVALGSMVFFYNTGKAFGSATLPSSKGSKPSWARSGDGILLFTGWLKAIFSGLRR